MNLETPGRHIIEHNYAVSSDILRAILGANEPDMRSRMDGPDRVYDLEQECRARERIPSLYKIGTALWVANAVSDDHVVQALSRYSPAVRRDSFRFYFGYYTATDLWRRPRVRHPMARPRSHMADKEWLACAEQWVQQEPYRALEWLRVVWAFNLRIPRLDPRVRRTHDGMQ